MYYSLSSSNPRPFPVASVNVLPCHTCSDIPNQLYGFLLIALMIEVVPTRETCVYFETKQRCISEDHNLHTRRHEAIKSHILTYILNICDYRMWL
jgi:hypothetical protein